MKELSKEVKADMVRYLILMDEFARKNISEDLFESEREKIFNLNGGVVAFFDLFETYQIDPDVPDEKSYDARLASRIIKSFNLLGVDSATNSNGLIATGMEGKRFPLFVTLVPDHHLIKAGIPAELGLTGVNNILSLKQAVEAFNVWQEFTPEQNNNI